MGVIAWCLGLQSPNDEPTIYVTTRNGLPYVGETGRGVAARYDKNDEERVNLWFTFQSPMTRKQRIAVEESLISDIRAKVGVTDNYDRHSKQKKRGRGK
jgi:hypothetical protein